MTNIKFDWDDISLIPQTLSDINSRSEINIYNNDLTLPLFAAPMDTVISIENANLFKNEKLNITLPRNIKYSDLNDDDFFYSYGLDEIIDILDNDLPLPKKVLIDIANGHMMKLYKTAKRIKETRETILMVGNIANPKTYTKYCEIGVDYIRVSIGSGGACLTAKNTGIFYPTASLIHECNQIKKQFQNPTKIIADGGFKEYADIIKALALGADYVMLGSILNKTFESAGDFYLCKLNRKITIEEAEIAFKNKEQLCKKFRGMSTKEVQKDWNKTTIKTSEGISKFNRVEYTLNGWLQNFSDYLKSSMSYTGCKNLTEFIGETEFIHITQNSYNRFNK